MPLVNFPNHTVTSCLSPFAPAMPENFNSTHLKEWDTSIVQVLTTEVPVLQSENVLQFQMLAHKAKDLVPELINEKLTSLSPAFHSWASLPTAPS